MKHDALFSYPAACKMILRDSFKEDAYYGLDEFDSKYLKIIQAKFGCHTSFHTIPDRVKMEMTPFEWDERRQQFIYLDNKRLAVQVNQLELAVVSYTSA